MAIAVLLFVIALAARALTAAAFSEPIYPDAFYYANLAREVATGAGLQMAYIWNFVEVGGALPATGTLPIPSNAHWMPLAALVQVPFILLLGATEAASGLPFWLAAAACAPLTYAIARDASMPRWQAAAAGLLVAMPAMVAPYLGQPDNFGTFMFLGSLALWLCARGLRGHQGSFALGGLIVGLAFLARNDGVLLGLPFALAFAIDRLGRRASPRIGWWPAMACLGGFLLVVAPWLARQLDVFGSISPSSAGGRILFIAHYAELYSVSTEATLGSFLAQGPLEIVVSRLGGLGSALFIFAVMPLLVVLVPMLLVGVADRRRDAAFWPWLVYGIVLFAFTTLVSAVHVAAGTFIHSAVALVPHAYLLSLIGLAVLVRFVAARRASWDVSRATRNLSLLTVGVIMVVSAASTVSTIRAWDQERAARAPLLEGLAARAHAGDRVMSPDAGAYRYHGGWGGIVIPDDPLSVVEEALRRYDVRWLAIERSHLTPGLRPVLAGEVRPTWLSEPLVVVLPPPRAADGQAHVPADAELPVAALYAVCLAPSDARCRA
jgi:4-amino-4-deoxy-L-arabinose transferase-like glycosyltransferase